MHTWVRQSVCTNERLQPVTDLLGAYAAHDRLKGGQAGVQLCGQSARGQLSAVVQLVRDLVLL